MEYSTNASVYPAARRLVMMLMLAKPISILVRLFFIIYNYISLILFYCYLFSIQWRHSQSHCSHLTSKSKHNMLVVELVEAWMTSIFIFSATFSQLIVQFKEEVFVAAVRTEFNTFTDFIASSGGICGLLLGASVLSFIELLYYLTIRVYFTYRQKLKIHAIESKQQPKIFTFHHESKMNNNDSNWSRRWRHILIDVRCGRYFWNIFRKFDQSFEKNFTKCYDIFVFFGGNNVRHLFEVLFELHNRLKSCTLFITCK